MRHFSYPYAEVNSYSRAVQFSTSFLRQAFVALITACAAASAVATTPPPADSLTADARDVRQWALENGDNGHQPFAVVDKKAARLFVFDADGRLLGATSVLLGQGLGDHSVPGVADIADLNRIPIADRTTPAGRFTSQPGRNLTGEAVVWFDYKAALAIHRVRPGTAQAQRMARLSTGGADDKRASLGCVVVPPAFYDTVIAPSLGRTRGVVYVLPEQQPVQAFFGLPVTTVAGRH